MGSSHKEGGMVEYCVKRRWGNVGCGPVPLERQEMEEGTGQGNANQNEGGVVTETTLTKKALGNRV